MLEPPASDDERNSDEEVQGLSDVAGDLNRCGSRGVRYDGVECYRCNLGNIKHIGRAKLLLSRGGSNQANSARAQPIGRPQNLRQHPDLVAAERPSAEILSDRNPLEAARIRNSLVQGSFGIGPSEIFP